MGYFSQLAVIKSEEQEALTDTRPTNAIHEILEFHLASLQVKLAALEETRPHDRLHPLYDRCFCSDEVRHYNEDPQTVQDILAAISEVRELLWDLDCYERTTTFEQEKAAEAAALKDAAPTQILMVGFWNYAFLFREAAIYKNALNVIAEE